MRASANTKVDVYRPASCALLKNEARKCAEVMIDAPESRVMKRNRMSDVLVNRTCVMIMEQAKNPGKYSRKNDR